MDELETRKVCSARHEPGSGPIPERIKSFFNRPNETENTFLTDRHTTTYERKKERIDFNFATKIEVPFQNCLDTDISNSAIEPHRAIRIHARVGADWVSPRVSRPKSNDARDSGTIAAGPPGGAAPDRTVLKFKIGRVTLPPANPPPPRRTEAILIA